MQPECFQTPVKAASAGGASSLLGLMLFTAGFEDVGVFFSARSLPISP